MAIPTSPLPVCRFAGLLAQNEEQLTAARFELAQWYGKIDDVSEVIPFSFTKYYDEEMGANLLRQWVRFESLFNPEHLAKCKLETNMAETLLARQFAERGIGVSPMVAAATDRTHPVEKSGKNIGGTPMPQRPINIDPGYVHRYKVILATTKDHSHRVYIAEGIFGEVTLHWHQNRWTAWPWTYADYQSEAAQAFFVKARAAYLERLEKLARVGH